MTESLRSYGNLQQAPGPRDRRLLPVLALVLLARHRSEPHCHFVRASRGAGFAHLVPIPAVASSVAGVIGIKRRCLALSQSQCHRVLVLRGAHFGAGP